MKTLIILLILVNLLVSPKIGHNDVKEKDDPPFKIEISAIKSTIKSNSDNEEVVIKVRLTNLSNHSINASANYELGLDTTYSYDIRDTSDKRIEMRKHDPGCPMFSRKY